MIQKKEDLERFYAKPDPWSYEANPHDERRRSEILAVVPKCDSILDVGCGDGFITFSLNSREIVGIDISENAIAIAKERAEKSQRSNISFKACSIFSMSKELKRQSFDLIIITGVLYPQYIGGAMSLVRMEIDKLMKPGGYLLSVHINEWNPPEFNYTAVENSFYPYREFTHKLVLYKKL